jgi:hypothetical protein
MPRVAGEVVWCSGGRVCARELETAGYWVGLARLIRRSSRPGRDGMTRSDDFSDVARQIQPEHPVDIEESLELGPVQHALVTGQAA